MRVPRSHARQLLGFQFRSFDDVASFGDRIAILEGYDPNAVFGANAFADCGCQKPRLNGLGDDVITSAGNTTLGGGSILFGLGVLAFVLSRRKK